jgi:hypothetical protein
MVSSDDFHTGRTQISCCLKGTQNAQVWTANIAQAMDLLTAPSGGYRVPRPGLKARADLGLVFRSRVAKCLHEVADGGHGGGYLFFGRPFRPGAGVYITDPAMAKRGC